jgi:hypothetical protein
MQNSSSDKRGGDGMHFILMFTQVNVRGGDPYDYEHLRSSGGGTRKYKSVLTDEIALVVNCAENVSVTPVSINQRTERMEEWLSPANITANGLT